MKKLRLLMVTLCVAVLMGSMAVTAYAGGGEEWDGLAPVEPLPAETVDPGEGFTEDEVEAIFDKINDMLSSENFADLDLVLEMRDRLFDTIVGAIKNQLRRIHEDPSGSTRASVLYLTILNETKTMVLQARNLLKSQRYFLDVAGQK